MATTAPPGNGKDACGKDGVPVCTASPPRTAPVATRTSRVSRDPSWRHADHTVACNAGDPRVGGGFSSQPRRPRLSRRPPEPHGLGHNTPKVDRVHRWIVQCARSQAPAADIWALCADGTKRLARPPRDLLIDPHHPQPVPLRRGGLFSCPSRRSHSPLRCAQGSVDSRPASAPDQPPATPARPMPTISWACELHVRPAPAATGSPRWTAPSGMLRAPTPADPSGAGSGRPVGEHRSPGPAMRSPSWAASLRCGARGGS